MKGPYIGPRPFDWHDEDDAQRFFGRDAEASELRFRVHANPVLVLFALAGAGKTSLLNAKLGPDLTEKDGFCVLPPLRPRAMHEPEDSIPNGSRSCARSLLSGWTQLAKDSDQASATFPTFLADRLRSPLPIPDNFCDLFSDAPEKSQFVIIFDQFDEFFTTAVFTRDQQKLFFGEIADCVQRYPSLRFVFAMRSESLALFDQCATPIPTPMRSRFYLEQLKSTAAEEAIMKPVEVETFGWKFDRLAAQKLVHALRSKREEVSPGRFETVEGEYIEPVQLQIVCEDIWQRVKAKNAASKRIGVDDIGSVDDPLGAYYAKAVTHASQKTGLKEWRIREWVERNLITEARTRGKVFRGADQAGGIPNQVPDVLLERRLIRSERQGGTWIELVHDSFIVPILESNLKWRKQLSGAELFEQELRSKAYKQELLDATEIAQARILLEKETANNDQPDKLLAELVHKSEEELERRRQEAESLEKLRRKIRLGVGIALAVISIALLIFWRQATDKSSLARKHTVMTKALLIGYRARDSIKQGADPNAVMLATIDGIALCFQEHICPPKDIVAAMNAAARGVFGMLEPPTRAKLGEQVADRDTGLPFIPLLSTPDGNIMVTVENEKTVVLWSPLTFQPIRLPALPEGVGAVSVSKDSRTLAVSTVDGSIWKCNIAQLPTGPMGYIMTFFSPNRDYQVWKRVPETRLEDVLDIKDEDYLSRSQKGAWKEYQAVTKRWLIDAAGEINRGYESAERISFPYVNSSDNNKTFSDRVFDVYTRIKPHPDCAPKGSPAAILRDFGLDDFDAGNLLTQLYVTHARSNVLKSKFLEAASNYDCAAALDSNSGFEKKAAALRLMEEGNVFATEGSSEKAKKKYEGALQEDPSLRRLIGDPAKSAQKDDFTPEVRKILDEANELAIQGKGKEAKEKYEEAKRQSPETLASLVPDNEVQKLAPKGPANTSTEPLPVAPEGVGSRPIPSPSPPAEKGFHEK